MKKRRILLALIMLIISGISLTTATYAWFTINKAVSVQEIDVRAQASGGIQISADATNWSNEVTLDDLKADGLLNVSNFIPTTALMPVTTIGVNSTTGKFDFFLGELNDAGDKVTLTAVEDSKNQYVAFDLYFYTASEKNVEFNAGTQVVAKNVANSASAAVDTGLKYSTRVGFLVQGTDSSATPSTAIALDDGTVDNQTIWEPNADEHTTYAANMSGASGVEAYMGGKAASSEAVATTNGTYFETITADDHGLITSNTADNYPSGTIFTFGAGITKVRVYVWLEGQDVDNEDTASLGSGVGVTLKFKIAEETQAG